MQNRYLLKITALLTAVGLTIAGSCYAVSRTREQLVEVNADAAEKQVIVLDAGHGASSKT